MLTKFINPSSIVGSSKCLNWYIMLNVVHITHSHRRKEILCAFINDYLRFAMFCILHSKVKCLINLRFINQKLNYIVNLLSSA